MTKEARICNGEKTITSISDSEIADSYIHKMKLKHSITQINSDFPWSSFLGVHLPMQGTWGATPDSRRFY